MVQDENGMMWIATTGGLTKYDSYYIQSYHPNSQSKGNIATDAINCLYRDRQGRIWITHSKGLSLYNKAQGDFINFSLDTPTAVSDIVELDPTHLLVNAKGNLTIFNTTDFHFRKLGLCRLNIKGVTKMFRYGDIVYIACDKGVLSYEVTTRRLSRLPIKGIAGSNIQAIFRSTPSKLYIGTEGNGLFCYDIVTRQCRQFTRQNSELHSDYIRTLSDDESGRVWVGTVMGLNIIEKNGIPESIKAITTDGINLQQASIRSIIRDKQGGMWIGTYFDGVCYYNSRKKHFDNKQNIPGLNSLANNIIGCITEDNLHNMWIGTNGGLHCYHPATQHFELFTTANGLLANDIKALYIDPNTHDIYVGSQLGGLAIINGNTHSVHSVKMKSNIADDNSIYSILPFGKEHLLLGSLTGLKLYNLSTQTISPLPASLRGDYSFPKQVRTLFRDKHGVLWVGGEDGLGAYKIQGGALRHVYLPKAYSEMSQTCVYTISEDLQGNVWVGTQQGLYAFLSNHTVKSYTDAQELPGNMVYGIQYDSLGKLWVSTNKGICCFNPTDNKFKYYTVKDGLTTNLFMPDATFKDANGRMYFGSINGITSFLPEQFTDNPFAPQPMITELKLYDQVVTPGDKTGILTHDITASESITLHYDQTDISLKLSVVNYLSGGHNTFAYKLEGYDKEWHYVRDGQSADYSYIPTGTYQLQVRAANNDGKWNDTTTCLEIKVLPPWYATWWAKTIYILLIIGATYALFNIFLNREKKKQEELRKQKEQEHQQEMYEMRQRFFIDISHELRTPLTLISSPLDEIMSQKQNAQTQANLHLIKKNVNRLIHLVNQLMDYRRAELNVFKLKVRPVQLAPLIEKVYTLYQENAQKRNIQYEWHCNDGGKETLCDPNYIEMILNNLVSNAFKYTPDGKSISVTATVTKDQLHLAVKDTGQGIPEEKQKRIFERFYQLNGKQANGWGIGLSIVTRLVELHHGKISVDSKLEEGSTFSISLPTSESAYSQEERVTDNPLSNDEIENLYKEVIPNDTKEEDMGTYVEKSSYDTQKPEEETEERPCLLITEDNDDIRHYLSHSLSEEYQVLEAANGREALQQVAEHEVNLILSDMMMPEMDGLELCKRIKTHIETSHIPIIFLSAKVDVSEQLEGLGVGADDYIPKPFSLMIVKTKIHNILHTHQQLIARYKAAKKIEPPKIAVNNLDEQWLEQALKAVNDNLTNEKFSTDDFARLMLMSRTSLYTKMKALTGESVKEFIRRIRLNRAAELILEGQQSIAEISYMVGFATPSYFTASFKKYFGCLPTEYQEKQTNV